MPDDPPFDRLRLARTDDRTKIKAAFNREVKLTPPDKFPGASKEQTKEHEAAFARVKEAFSFLIDPARRRQYLQSLDRSPENRDGMDAASVPETLGISLALLAPLLAYQFQL